MERAGDRFKVIPTKDAAVNDAREIKELEDAIVGHDEKYDLFNTFLPDKKFKIRHFRDKQRWMVEKRNDKGIRLARMWDIADAVARTLCSTFPHVFADVRNFREPSCLFATAPISVRVWGRLGRSFARIRGPKRNGTETERRWTSWNPTTRPKRR